LLSRRECVESSSWMILNRMAIFYLEWITHHSGVTTISNDQFWRYCPGRFHSSSLLCSTDTFDLAGLSLVQKLHYGLNCRTDAQFYANVSTWFNYCQITKAILFDHA
jgi:hypothetical protein